MNLLKQRNNVECGVTALAMVINRSPDEIMEAIGHDGREKVWPSYQEPLCFRGFHAPEIVEAALHFGYAAIKIDFNYHIIGTRGQDPITAYTDDEVERRLDRYMLSNVGIIFGAVSADKKHAVAWDGKLVYDPHEPRTYSFDTVGIEKISIESFLLIRQLQ